MGEDVGPDGSDQHVVRPGGLQHRLLDPLHIDIETALLEGTGECVRR